MTVQNGGGISQGGGGGGSGGGGGGGGGASGSGFGNIANIWVVIAGEVFRAETAPGPPIKIKPSEIARFIHASQQLTAAGHQPVLSDDPFTGGFVLSRASQAPILEDLLLEHHATAAGLFDEIPPEEEPFFHEGPLREFDPIPFSVPLGGPPIPQPNTGAVAAIPPPVHEIPPPVTAANPLPGVVTRGGRLSSKRTSGPCAGVVTGIAKLRCSRGRGFR